MPSATFKHKPPDILYKARTSFRIFCTKRGCQSRKCSTNARPVILCNISLRAAKSICVNLLSEDLNSRCHAFHMKIGLDSDLRSMLRDVRLPPQNISTTMGETYQAQKSRMTPTSLQAITVKRFMSARWNMQHRNELLTCLPEADDQVISRVFLEPMIR